MHSAASDGTDSPKELLEKVQEAGISCFSLTDHDTIEGVEEIEPLIPEGITFIRGIEFSCITGAGKCHILGYGYDKDNASFRALIEEGARRRVEKLNKRVRYLKEEFGIVLDDSDIAELNKVKRVGKTHLGNLLVMKGIEKDKNTAIEKYITPCPTGIDRLEGEETIRVILEAGGVPVWAHPLGGTGEAPISLEDFKNQLKLLKKAGLIGLECFYSKYGAEEIGLLTSFAGAEGLLISGGSDYHGKNKTVKLLTLNAAGFPVGDEKLTVLQKLKP